MLLREKRGFGDQQGSAWGPAWPKGTTMGQFTARMLKFAVPVAAAVFVSACGGYDVELKGGVFDALGVNDNQNRKEPKLADRPGLVVPPSTASLPTPGSAPPAAVAANGEAFPVNPEDARKQGKEVVLARHNAFCAKARQRHQAGVTSDIESSPWGSCHQSVLRTFTGKDLSGKAIGER